MKYVNLLLVLIFCQVGMAQTADSQNYNLGQSTIDSMAAFAKFAIITDGSAILLEVVKGNGALSLNKFAKPADIVKPADIKAKICFRVGNFLSTVLESSVRYDFHAVNTDQKARGTETTRLALKASTYCGFKPEEVVNPDYSKLALGTQDLNSIGTISTTDELQETVKQIMAITKTSMDKTPVAEKK